MPIPHPLMGLIEDGIINEVLRPLQSGKETQVFLVMLNGERLNSLSIQSKQY